VPTCNFTTGAGCNVGAVRFFSSVVNANLTGYGNIFYQPNSCPPFPCNEGVLNGLPGALPAFSPGAPTGYLLDLLLGDLPPAGAGGTAYTLTDAVNTNGANVTYNASATLNAVPTVLGAPATAPYTATTGTGGGSFALGAYPAGATEQVVVVLGGAPPNSVKAMVEAVAPATTATLPPGTLAVGAYQCFVIAADFPWVEAGIPNPNPVIVGTNGNADLSASGTLGCTQT